MNMFPAELKHSKAIIFSIQRLYCKQYHFCNLFSAINMWGFLWGFFFLGILPFKIVPKNSAEVLSSDAEHKNTVMCLTENTRC